jgi:hypothetical protein
MYRGAILKALQLLGMQTTFEDNQHTLKGIFGSALQNIWKPFNVQERPPSPFDTLPLPGALKNQKQP